MDLIVLIVVFSILEGKRTLKTLAVSSSHMVDLVFLFHSSFLFSFLFYFSIFLFLEQLGLGWIGHAVTSVTT